MKKFDNIKTIDLLKMSRTEFSDILIDKYNGSIIINDDKRTVIKIEYHPDDVIKNGITLESLNLSTTDLYECYIYLHTNDFAIVRGVNTIEEYNKLLKDNNAEIFTDWSENLKSAIIKNGREFFTIAVSNGFNKNIKQEKYLYSSILSIDGFNLNLNDTVIYHLNLSINLSLYTAQENKNYPTVYKKIN